MTKSCVFCEIANGTRPADLVYEDEVVVAFRDVAPQAPHHVLIVPRRHVPSAAHAQEVEIWGRIMVAAVRVAEKLELDEIGYRLVVNCGEQACQTIPHLHVHLLSGRFFRWPPG